MFLPRGPLPALVFITRSSWFSFAARLQGLWGWWLPRHCPHRLGDSRSWRRWRVAGQKCWELGGQHPAGAQARPGQVVKDGGRCSRGRELRKSVVRTVPGLFVVPPGGGQPGG